MNYKTKVCQVCGEEYQPTSPTQKYCAECRRVVNAEKAQVRAAKWRKANPETGRFHHAKHRAAKYANTPISELLTSTEWLAILAQADGHCAYCGKEAKLTLDHVIPLAKGGKHSKDNIVAACTRCNCSKKDKTVEEWIKTTGKGLRELQTQRSLT